MLSLGPRTSLESVTDLASIVQLASPKVHRVIARPCCSSPQCQSDAIRTEAEGLASENCQTQKQYR